MKILLLGSTGQVGSELTECFANSHHHLIALPTKICDLSKPDTIIASLMPYDVDLVINAAAYTAVDKAEDEKELAYQINAFAVRELAQFCSQAAIPLIHFSTDYVFDGNKAGGYLETDEPAPLGVYGESKLFGEKFIQTHLDKHLILRISWVFSKYRQNFVKTILNLASHREELRVVADQWGRPTSAKALANLILKLVEAIRLPTFTQWGIYHYADQGLTNWHEFASYFLRLAEAMGYPLAMKELKPIDTSAYPTKARRPKNSVLDTSKIEKVFNIQPSSWSDYLTEVIAATLKKDQLA